MLYNSVTSEFWSVCWNIPDTLRYVWAPPQQETPTRLWRCSSACWTDYAGPRGRRRLNQIRQCWVFSKTDGFVQCLSMLLCGRWLLLTPRRTPFRRRTTRSGRVATAAWSYVSVTNLMRYSVVFWTVSRDVVFLQVITLHVKLSIPQYSQVSLIKLNAENTFWC